MKTSKVPVVIISIYALLHASRKTVGQGEIFINIFERVREGKREGRREREREKKCIVTES